MPQGPYIRAYGVATTVPLELYEADGIDFRVDAVYASGDMTITKNEGTEANTTNGFVDEGTGYSIALTATEMQAARIMIYVVDQTATKVWLDTSIAIETIGGPSSQHPVAGESLVSTTIAVVNSQVSFTLTEGSADNDAYNLCTAIVTDASTGAQKAFGRVDDYVGSTKTVTLKRDPAVFTMAAGDFIEIVAPPLGQPGVIMEEDFSIAGGDASWEQMLHEIRQTLMEFGISGTTMTVRKKDGVTAAMTVTLNDAADPTDRTRAT